MSHPRDFGEVVSAIVGLRAVRRLDDGLLAVDWSLAGNQLYELQARILNSLAPGEWMVDLEDVLDPSWKPIQGMVGMGCMVRVHATGFNAVCLRDLSRQQWLGLACGAPLVARIEWRIAELFERPARFSGLVAEWGFAIGIVSYFDGDSWLVYHAPPSRTQVRCD